MWWLIVIIFILLVVTAIVILVTDRPLLEDRSVTENVDWSTIVRELIRVKFITRTRLSDHDDHGGQDDKLVILELEGVPVGGYGVRVESLSFNPDNKRITYVEDRLLEAYKKHYPQNKIPKLTHT